MRHPGRRFYEFGPFRLDPQKRRLLCNGEVVLLPPKAIDALLVLVERPGRMLERETLMDAVWGDAVVEDANLTVAISQARKALDRNGNTGEYIETIPRVGYRFVAEVREVQEESTPLVVEKHTVEETVIEEETSPTTQGAVANRHATVALLAVLVLIGVAWGAALYLKRNKSRPVATPVRSLAVLAPRALSPEAETSSLSLGIADALITRLGGLQKVVVRPTSAISRYMENREDPLDVGRALRVDAVLEGTLQRAEGRVRITMRLLDVRSGSQLWAGRFDEADADIFKLQDLMSAEIADALALKLTHEERASLTRLQTGNAEAYAHYLKGIYFWNKRGVEVTKSIPHFQKAIALDPNFARAYVGLANVHAVTSSSSPEAETLIEKALQLDSTLAEAHATQGLIRMFHKWDWAGAEKAFDRALALDPNCAVAHHWRGVYLSLRGRLDEAKAEMHRALDLDPQSAIITADIGQLHYFAHQYDQAIAYCRRALELDKEMLFARVYLRDIYVTKKMEHEAFAEYIICGHAESFFSLPDIRASFASSGLKGVARMHLEYYFGSGRALAEASPEFVVWYCLVAGDKEQTLRWLGRSYEEHAFLLPFIAVDPLYDPLRGDPRFQEIVRRMGLRS